MLRKIINEPSLASTGQTGQISEKDYNNLPHKDSTPKLAAKRSQFSSNSIQIQFRFNSDSIYFRKSLYIVNPILYVL
ncbi:hypothetical protein VN97_g6752 [Penicillium thymicola]|uniref:Uncharacterized protein n=1 Tax=Penicillium thymicola TaxID=293382 RepID=A0AAI9X7Q6_PENTH|nr:hypothetical protein VN97_g6752 [Penicillium thymicola]